MIRPINVGIIGTGWCGGIRATACAANPLVDGIYIAEVRQERLAEVAGEVKARKAATDWRELLGVDEIDAFFISATPETTHFPMARECLSAGKHVFLEKPIALELHEADELIQIAREKQVKFTIGYSQRFNHKFAYVKERLNDGTLGTPISALVSRHIARSLGNKISGRTKLSPAAMEATHDIDYILWLLEPRKPVKVYSQWVYGVKKDSHGVPDCQWITITMDDGIAFVVGAGWILPPGYPNFSWCWIEFIGSEGAVFVDNTHRDVVHTTMQSGAQFPMSSMPGEFVGHTYAGPMAPETDHFVAACALDRPVLVTPEQARTVMECYIAADLSAERGEPVTLPLPEGRGA